MTISVTLPDAWQAFRNELQKASAGHNDQCWDVVGEPLNKAVRETVPKYLEKLELRAKETAKTAATSKRGEILDLYWGRIEQDAASLVGLGAALENLSAMIETNVTALAEHWSGESYEAFKTAMGKIRTTLDAYSAGAKEVGGILQEAMTQARQMYADYVTASQEALRFDWISPPEHWHKLDDKASFDLALYCPDHSILCQKTQPEAIGKIVGKFVTTRQLDAVRKDPCEDNLERVLIMFDNMVAAGEEGRGNIREQIDGWFTATDDLKANIKELLEVAVGNVYTLAESQAFSSLRVVGGGAGTGQPAGEGGYPAGGDGGYPGGGTGSYPADSGGYHGGGDTSAEPIVDPTAAPDPEPADPAAEGADPAAEGTDPGQEPEPAVNPGEEETADPAAEAPAAEDPATEDPATETPATETPATEDPAAVTISDGDRTIGVSNPGVEGHVKVTVTDAEGVTKTYDLDFDAASGLAPVTGDAQQATEEGVEHVPARTDGKCVIQDGDVTITAERPLFAPDQITLTVDDGTGTPATYTVDFPDAPEEPAAEPEPAGTGGQDVPQAGTAAGPDQQDGQLAAAAEPAEEPAPTGQAEATPADAAVAESAPNGAAVPASTGTEGQAPDAAATSTADVKGDPEASAAGTSPANADARHTGPGVTTVPQAWTEDARGSVSGVLEPEHPAPTGDGEAALAKADDQQAHDATGMAGAGLPMAGAPGGGSSDAGRPGSGWSVHGDLFDNGEPVYSVHGVLGDEDADGTGR